MITVTDRAAQEVKRIMSDQGLEDGTMLRISVSGGGCSGFSYVMQFESEAKETDQAAEFAGLKVLLGAEAAPYIDNTVLDFNDEVGKRGFVFDNPNSSGTCGCGTSFSV